MCITYKHIFMLTCVKMQKYWPAFRRSFIVAASYLHCSGKLICLLSM